MNFKLNKKIILLCLTGVTLCAMPGCEKQKETVVVEQTTSNDDYQTKSVEQVEKVEEVVVSNEDKIMNEFEQIKEETYSLINQGEDEETVDKNMLKYMDFIYQNQEVEGMTIDELSTDNQNKIKTDFLCLKEYLEETKPKWYERLKEVSIEVKDYLVYGYHEVKDTLTTWKEEGTLKENIKKEAKEMYEKDKETVKGIWNKAKQLVKEK